MQAQRALTTPGIVDLNEARQTPDPPLTRSTRRRVRRMRALAIRMSALFLQGPHKSPLFGTKRYTRSSIARSTAQAASAPRLSFPTLHRHGQAALSAKHFRRKEQRPAETQRSIPQTLTLLHKPVPASKKQ